MSKTGFKEIVKNEEKKIDSKAWNYKAPSYDERSSCFINAGEKHGVGHKQPVGSLKHSSSGGVSFGKVKTLESDEIA